MCPLLSDPLSYLNQFFGVQSLLAYRGNGEFNAINVYLAFSVYVIIVAETHMYRINNYKIRFKYYLLKPVCYFIISGVV